MYGCFLQALQVLLGWKRINSDPIKNRMQEHELFLYLVEKALRRLRFSQFIALLEAAVFVKKDDETPHQHLLRVDLAFETFCSDWEMSKDGPTRVCT